jgi:cytochrome c-type biogenesis protein CcmH
VRTLAVVIAFFALAPPALASDCQRTLSRLEGDVICPICRPETIAQSSSPIAQKIKKFIVTRCQAGASDGQIKRALVANFGSGILAAPPKHGFDLLAWVLPLVGIIGGALALAAVAWRWTRAREPAGDWPPQALNGRPLDPELERRLDEELARFDT